MRKLIPLSATALMALAALTGIGCSNNRFSAYRQIDDFRETESFRVENIYEKAVSDPRSGSVFAMSKASQEVHIFRKGIQINSIGGLGFERTNFQRLSDIGVDTDGGLLALDSAQKLLRKFSPEGSVIAEQQLSDLRQPELFCVSGDGTLFVYDSATSEIVSYSPLDNTELYRFGRFEIEHPVSIACNNDYLYIYSETKASTYVFYLLGQFKESSTMGQLVYDDYNNAVPTYKVTPGYYSSLPKLITINSDEITVLYGNEIRLLRVNYARGEDAAR